MKKTLLITLLIISMLAVVGFTPLGESYWGEVKEIYEWGAMKGETEAEFDLSIPEMGINYQYKIYIDSQSNLDDFNAYSKIKVQDLEGKLVFPVIEMYTYGSDLYINTEAVLAILSVAGISDGVKIDEEFIMLKNEVGVEVNSDILNDALDFLRNMDLGIDLDMIKEGNTYTLELESDELIDLIDAYMKYVIENIDKMPASLTQGQGILITEAEKQEALESYNAFINQYKDMAKLFAKGSTLSMQATFEDDEYDESFELDIKTPLGKLRMASAATTSKIEATSFELPTSVKVVTAEELAELMISVAPFNKGAKATVKLDGSYIKKTEKGFEAGKIPLEIKDNLAHITVADTAKLFGVELKDIEDPFHMRKLDDYGFYVEWNEVTRTIEIY